MGASCSRPSSANSNTSHLLAPAPIGEVIISLRYIGSPFSMWDVAHRHIAPAVAALNGPSSESGRHVLWSRVDPTTGGGLLAAAPRAAGGGPCRSHGHHGGLRRVSVPAASCEVPRDGDRCALPR